MNYTKWHKKDICNSHLKKIQLKLQDKIESKNKNILATSYKFIKKIIIKQVIMVIRAYKLYYLFILPNKES